MSLGPTRFHRALRDTLTSQEPGLFRWYSSDSYEAERNDRMRLELLRSSYRLSPESHERPYRLAREAAAKIGVEVPIVLYQLNQGERANAGLCFTRDEAHVVLSGPLLSSLNDAELLAEIRALIFKHGVVFHAIVGKLFQLAASLSQAARHVAQCARLPSRAGSRCLSLFQASNHM